MSFWWIAYWISVAVVIIISTVVRRFFTLDGKFIPRIHVLLACMASFVPVVGTVEALFGLGFLFTSLADDDLKLKESPFSNEKLNNFFLN